MNGTELTSAEYRILVEQAPLLIWRSNRSKACDYFNERWLAFTGRTLEQELGDGWAEGVHPADLQRCIEIYSGSFDARRAFEMEYRLRRHDGEYRWLFDRGVPYSVNGQFAGYIGSCIDVTDRVEAQLRLREAHERELADLRGLLPICAHCNRIRDERGDWQRVDRFVASRSRADFSHGICPCCLDRHFPQG